MIYFTKRPKKITKKSQVKEMLNDSTLIYFDELKKLEVCAEMVYTREYDLALEVFKEVDFNQIVATDKEYYYEVALSIYASLNMIEEFLSVLHGYAEINNQVSVEILSEFFINNYDEISDKHALENFAVKHLESDDFKDYIVMISRYLNGDLAYIREIVRANIGRVVNLDIFHQQLYYELAIIAVEEAGDIENSKALKEDLGSFDKGFLNKIERFQVANVPFKELVVYRKEKAMRSKKKNKEIVFWIIFFIALYFIFM